MWRLGYWSRVNLLQNYVTLSTLPATDATSERSFSALRRLKTYLRSTMSQSRLNHLMFIHVNNDKLDNLCFLDIGNEFVTHSEHRKSVFGKFSKKDKTSVCRKVSRDISTQTTGLSVSECKISK